MPFRQEGRRSNNYNQGSPTNTPNTTYGLPPAPGLPEENYPQGPLGPPDMPVPFDLPGGYPFVSEADLANPNPVSEIPYPEPPMPFPEVTPPGPYSPNFPSGEILSPYTQGALEPWQVPLTENNYQFAGEDRFPLADLPTRPFPPNSPIAGAPSPPRPGNPIAGRVPASPTPPNPFGVGK